MADKSDNQYTFTPIHPFKMDEPKTCDKIVFSKRSLLEFLKSCQLTVNTNFTEIQKLANSRPEYASFGHMSQAATDEAVKDLIEAEINDHEDPKPSSSSQAATTRPSRKVVDPPGGKQSFKLYGEEYEEADALSLAPPKDGGPGVDIDIDRMEHLKLHVEPEADGGAHIEDLPDENKIELGPGEKVESATAEARNTERESNPPPNFRPTRKVREGPGGKSQMGAAMFGGVEDEEDVEAPRKRSDKNASSGLW
ncbi:hypothetical protein CC85DRAFT_281903 [Cutaneotrichosporon oleaginosum]|uniref:Uncharacterized protein n=1 Tax=Cutaneotrichosporon oleaginosum TaxID=879819 RepID=A0A0J0XYX1_9TREE|nr:uncharacterized protein CC85DRAFT_281903 [Cutaneotrichosporon oleaginosum]KLT46252.1 hypothetical protein CC85DRAFT_281903 [Cutaneotrichosporon oleaginosum]